MSRNYAIAGGNATQPTLSTWRKPVGPPKLSADCATFAEGAALFNLHYSLVKAGAKWGDTEVYDFEEWSELVAIRLAASLFVPPADVNTFEMLLAAGTIIRAIIQDPEPEPEQEPIAEYVRPPCEVCGIYLSHSSADFEGRNLCCGWCAKQKGTDHGERCERCPLAAPVTDYNY
jgi:hypothetical protein